jgi:hypothetical protein
MPPRREHEHDENLGLGVRLLVRWVAERDIVSYAVMLLVETDGDWRTVVLFDCSHGDRNDRHRYTFDGAKCPATTFHRGTPSEAMNDAIDLIGSSYERMIEQWRQ